MDMLFQTTGKPYDPSNIGFSNVDKGEERSTKGRQGIARVGRCKIDRVFPGESGMG